MSGRVLTLFLFLSFFFYVPFVSAEDTGHIQVNCEPGITIFLAGNIQGVSSAEFGGYIIQDVPVGKHELKAVKEGFTPQIKAVTVEKDSVTVVELGTFVPKLKITESGESEDTKLNAEVCVLEIKTLPVECTIECAALGLLGVKKTKDIWSAENVPIGKYDLTLRFGVKSLSAEFEISKDIKTTITANFLKMEISVSDPAKKKAEDEKIAEIFEKLKALAEKAPVKLIAISPGSFQMGSNDGNNDGKPVHEVILTNPFYMGATEVTQSQWKAVMGNNPSNFKGDDLPMECVSWNDCVEFCQILTETERQKGNLPDDWEYRLPTEAEWEYCCRAGSTTEYCFGDDKSKLGEYAWFYDNSGEKTHPVGTKKPNAWGLYDMHGNVWEWCLDKTALFSRVICGGSWFFSDEFCRCAYHSSFPPDDPFNDLGFRLVLAQCSEMVNDQHTAPPVVYTIVPGLAAKSPFRLVSIPAGSFMMGSNTGQPNEKPVHKVTLTKPFYMSASEVTQSQWRAVMGNNPSCFKGDDLPVDCVSWDGCVKFCEKLTETEKAKGNLPADWEYRLPTEAEWEYCCRAGSTTAYCFGNDASKLGEYAWFADNSGYKTHAVGTKKPNAFGLYDMYGNVKEWCLDWYGDYTSGDATDPVGPQSGSDRVARGGSWGFNAVACRCAGRDYYTTRGASNNLGFRLVLAQYSEKAVVQHTPPPVVYTIVPGLAAKSPLKLVSIPAGSFTMGSNDGDDDEKPVHKVTISKRFYMSATEVTQSQWNAVMGNNPSYFKGDDLPVESVSWDDCVEFCKKLTETEKAKGNLPTDYEYRLPTEAEWEYCCRAGSTTEYCFGDDRSKLGEYAWFADNSGNKSHAVGTKKPNAWGLYDMHGNIWELCLDLYGDYSSSDATDPQRPQSRSLRVKRGGSWSDRAVLCRSANRSYITPDDTYFYLGFRLVLAQCSEMVNDQHIAQPVVKTIVPDLASKSPLKLVSIPAGLFTMGSNVGDDDEKPVHKVTLTKPFYMGATEVTQAQWKAVMESNPSKFMGDDLPVECISWNDCVEFCRKLTETEKAKGNLPADWEYRLPTEAEWEYCCRAGSTTSYSFGDDENRFGEYAWFWENSGKTTNPVGKKKPNAWGLYDMHGNVWEWCLDWYGDFTSGDATDPVGPQSGSNRVIRGGSWYYYAERCRCANRNCTTPNYSYSDLGFRLVLAQCSKKAVDQHTPPPVVEFPVPDLLATSPLKLVSIPAGSFTMGSNTVGKDEKPIHKVTISKPFYIGATEVTQSQWRAVMGNNPSYFKGDDLPVESVSWDDCVEFCRKLTETEKAKGNLPAGYEYRLPTEAEWEYCCRAGSTTKYCFGDDESRLGEYAWFRENSEKTPHPVGTKKPNAWGLYDMHGNVQEWCLDWYADKYKSGNATNPQGPQSGSRRINRGGSWYYFAEYCRCAFRNYATPDSTIATLGFRLVLAPVLR